MIKLEHDVEDSVDSLRWRPVSSIMDESDLARGRVVVPFMAVRGPGGRRPPQRKFGPPMGLS